jgi:hypothetical protein
VGIPRSPRSVRRAHPAFSAWDPGATATTTAPLNAQYLDPRLRGPADQVALDLLELLLLQVSAEQVQPADHPLVGALQQLVLVDRIDVVPADQRVHLREDVQVLEDRLLGEARAEDESERGQTEEEGRKDERNGGPWGFHKVNLYTVIAP